MFLDPTTAHGRDSGHRGEEPRLQLGQGHGRSEPSHPDPGLLTTCSVLQTEPRHEKTWFLSFANNRDTAQKVYLFLEQQMVFEAEQAGLCRI